MSNHRNSVSRSNKSLKNRIRSSGLVGRGLRFLSNRGDRLNSLRRNVEMWADQAYVLSRWRLARSDRTPPFDGRPRFALITVNFSTTRLLKLMLLTLGEQKRLDLVHRVVIVDNDNRDGGAPFLRQLEQLVPRLHLVEQLRFPTHARGLRLGVRCLDTIERALPTDSQSNVLLPCDTDIIFRDPGTLDELRKVFEDKGTSFAGELRRGLYPYPEAQASFFAVRRDIYARPDVVPFVHHGAPAYFMQRSLHRAGLYLEDFPSNFGGYILHRGRSGVAATRTYRTHDPHATAKLNEPHFMGVPGGRAIWTLVEKRYAALLAPSGESALLEKLGESLEHLGPQGN